MATPHRLTTSTRILLHLRNAAGPNTKLLIADHLLPLACVDEDDEALKDSADGKIKALPGTVRSLAPDGSPLLPNLGKANANAYWMDLTVRSFLPVSFTKYIDRCVIADACDVQFARSHVTRACGVDVDRWVESGTCEWGGRIVVRTRRRCSCGHPSRVFGVVEKDGESEAEPGGRRYYRPHLISVSSPHPNVLDSSLHRTKPFRNHHRVSYDLQSTYGRHFLAGGSRAFGRTHPDSDAKTALPVRTSRADTKWQRRVGVEDGEVWFGAGFGGDHGREFEEGEGCEW